MNGKMVRYIIGWILIFEAIFLLLPMITAVIYSETDALLAFSAGALLCLLLGWGLKYKRPQNTVLYSREGFVIVALSWIVLSAFGALPLCICGAVPNYIDALFETVSGFTTTGASIIPVVEEMPHSVLIWRSFTHFIGGMGVLVFVMAFLPLSGGQNMHIMKAESTGPSVSKLVPKVKATALILYSIYFALTVVQFILLLIGDMSVFDALNTALSTAGTGGFGFKNDSMGSYSSYIQIIVTVFMLLFSVNFAGYYLVLKGRYKEFFNSETKAFIAVVLASVAIITLNTYKTFSSVGEAIKHVFFTVASVISTTGFATVDFDLWPTLSKVVLIFIMFTGACAGSTCGGIKLSRLMIWGKSTKNELGGLLHTRQVKKVMIDSRPVEERTVTAVHAFMGCYTLIFAASMLVISLEGVDLVTSFTSVTTAINNVGPGLGRVGPTGNFAFYSIPSKLVLIFDMLAGRLEVFPMLLLFSPSTWRR